MKKHLTLLVLLILSSSYAQIINFPDPNFKARLLTPGTGYLSGGAMNIDANSDGEIQVSEALLVLGLSLNNANISSISGIEYFTNLTALDCAYNPLTSMDLTPLTHLTRLNIYYNQLTSLNIAGLSNLQWCNCFNNQLTSIDLTGANMYMLQCQNNQLTSLNLSNATNLSHLDCHNNLLTSLDVNNLSTIYTLNCASNNLTQLSLKNGLAEFNLDFSANPNLQYICADDFQLITIQNKIAQYGYTNCFANSYCSFAPGNPVYTIEGSAKYDELSDGCDAADISYPNLKLICSDGTNTGNVFANTNGEFSTGVQSATITITPELENPAYFSVTPTSQTIPLSGPSSISIQNFCITPNGLHPDLEVSIVKTNSGESAYNYVYTITYKNKGTNTQSGTISLAFDDNLQDFTFAIPTVSSAATGLVTWNFSDLKPFEIRAIQVQFYMNLGTTLFDGDILNYVANITSSSVDETPSNNTYTLNEPYSSVVLLNNPDHSFSDYFAIFPNPTRDLLYIKTKNNVSIDTITIYNLFGQTVIQEKNISKDAIDVSGLGTGTYIIKITSDKGMFNGKFVKN